jgi:hypothetical protein
MIYFEFQFKDDIENSDIKLINSMGDDVHCPEGNKILSRMREYQVRICTDNESLIKYIEPLKEKCSLIIIKRTSDKTDILDLETVYRTNIVG